jgi:DNA-binding response OmpR family regulator
VEGRLVHLTPKEFEMLSFLLRRRGEVLTPDELSLQIWGYETFGSPNFVAAHVSRLRRKLSAADAVRMIDTIRGVGYVIR